MAEEWNRAGEDDAQQADQRSVYSYKSGASRASKASYKSKVNDEMKKFQEKAQSEWDATTVNSETKRLTTEERMARKIAKEVLMANKKLGNVHSDASLQKLLEREAKKHLEAEVGASG